MTKKEMMDIVIRTYGHEHKCTIAFFQYAEELPNRQLFHLFFRLIDNIYQQYRDEE